MATFTSSLPDDILKQLAAVASRLNLPKNRVIEKALRVYLEQLDKAAFAKSYKQMSQDVDMLQLAEEGMAEYYKEIIDQDEN